MFHAAASATDSGAVMDALIDEILKRADVWDQGFPGKSICVRPSGQSQT